MPNYISPPPQNPIARILTGIVAVVVLAGAFMVGLAALLVVAGIGLLAGIVIWLRVAWIKHKLKKDGIELGVTVEAPASTGHVIDAEYTVISEQQDQRSE